MFVPGIARLKASVVVRQVRRLGKDLANQVKGDSVSACPGLLRYLPRSVLPMVHVTSDPPRGLVSHLCF